MYPIQHNAQHPNHLQSVAAPLKCAKKSSDCDVRNNKINEVGAEQKYRLELERDDDVDNECTLENIYGQK